MSERKRVSTLLVADDDSVVRKLIGFQFDQAGLYCDLFESGEDLLKMVNEDTQTCVLDLKMPGKGGIDCLIEIKKKYPHVEVIILTNVNQAAEAVEAVRTGAFDYITKPFDPEDLVRSVRKAMRMSRNQRENEDLRSVVSVPNLRVDILGKSEAMGRVKDLLSRVATSDSTVLLTGESGTGKTVHAHAIHKNSPRREGSFVSVSCPSLPGDLLESEMFGHEKGAFSGAVNRRLGRAELANNGTLFLDEIGEMPLNLQAKLLTFLQEKTFYRLGGEKPLSSNARIIAATNQNLEELIAKGQFREDLYFRLNVLPIEIPPLRERVVDIPDLVDHFLNKAAQADSIKAPAVESEVYTVLKKHDWPGNIRELENAVVRAYTLRQEDGSLSPSDFAFGGIGSALGNESSNSVSCGSTIDHLIGSSLADIEKQVIIETLKYCNNNKSEAARVLGIAEKSIYNKIKKYQLS